MKGFLIVLTVFAISIGAKADPNNSIHGLTPDQLELARARGAGMALVVQAQVAAILGWVAPNQKDMKLERLVKILDNTKEENTRRLAIKIISKSTTPKDFEDTVGSTPTIVDALYESFQNLK